MLDFLIVSTRIPKKGIVEVYPKFVTYGSKLDDLMIRGGDFYAVWNEDTNLWSTDEQDALRLIDIELDQYAKDHKDDYPDTYMKVMHMWDSESGSIDKWHKFVQKQMRDRYHPLDEALTFANTETTKSDYASKRLSYPFEKVPTPAYDELMDVLYSPEERHKIEWAIGAIVAGDAKNIQKFIVMYGAPKTGKSTVLNIIQQLFDGYWSAFDAKTLGNANSSFALEAFRANPLVGIQHDGDLSRIEDNTRLNSLVSHEVMMVNEKFKSAYATRFNTFLFMGTNKPVRITDAKSGIIRRLIDVSPTGDKVSTRKYVELTSKIRFELGGIAAKCLDIYREDPGAYDNYVPLTMMGASNDFYNFVMESFDIFKEEDGVTMKRAWEMYKAYCEDANVPYPYSQRIFKEELKNYFRDFKERAVLKDDSRVRNYYEGFITEKFDILPEEPKKKTKVKCDFELNETESLLDKMLADCPAQYANDDGTPIRKWDNVTTMLKDIATTKLHYIRPPENHIVIDFDLKDENGNKSFELNAKAASLWPPTYAELSKGGHGIHLHYIYSGDVTKLSSVYEPEIEVKVFSGLSSLRRKLTKCNDIPVATISTGLPLKKEGKMISFEGLKNEKALRTVIKRNLRKEYLNYTKPSIDFIYKSLEDAYNSGMAYDVTDMRQAVLNFASSSTNNAAYCIKMVNKMKFKSEELPPDIRPEDTETLVFFDVEVFPNLFIVVYKPQGRDCVKMINPTPKDIEMLIKLNLVGFNCRRYDNHILYARLLGKTNAELYDMSQKIVSGSSNAFYSNAYNLSYTDIYDFASAGNKKSLKKLEIEMGIHHQECPLRWDEDVPDDKVEMVADYCINDVIATEKAFEYLKADWTARQILADIAGMSYNTTTNELTTRIIFDSNKRPQSEFNYRDMGKPCTKLDAETIKFLEEACPDMMTKRFEQGSLLPWFPGYKFEYGKSTYLDINEDNPDPKRKTLGEGGCVYAEPGMYTDVALLDIASQHPHSIIAECLFGPKYTRHFRDIVEGRVSIKHQAWNEVDKLFDGKLKPYIEKVKKGEMTAKELANGLKTAINSVYGLTSASFDNPFRDPRNVDNIVAKRGALFMTTLRHEVWKRGFTVAHIKTDSIKIPNATPEIIHFVMDFGKRYGYSFEHEATYERMCLVNNAVYIARYKDADECKGLYGYVPDDCAKHGGQWTATGAEFAHPFIFKTLFSHEQIVFDDMCETKSVKSAMYLDMGDGMNHDYRFVGKTGSFCPMLDKGGYLVREAQAKDGSIKYDSVVGTKEYKWLEAESVKGAGLEGLIDISYFRKLVDDALTSIQKFGDSEWFVNV